MIADVSLLPSVPAWRAQGAYTFLNCLKLAILKVSYLLEVSHLTKQPAAVRQGEFRLISFLWFSGDA